MKVAGNSHKLRSSGIQCVPVLVSRLNHHIVRIVMGGGVEEEIPSQREWRFSRFHV
jgi:hypothetical protein